MGWIIFAIWMFCGLLYHVFEGISKGYAEGSKERKYIDIIKWIPVGIIGLMVVCIILYIIGCLWYFFCGGFLLFEDQPFIDKVFCGLLSVAVLVVLLEGLTILAGINKK